MKSRTFFILLVVCAALAGASWFMLRPEPSHDRKNGNKTGEHLLAKLPVNDILQIDIDGPAGGVVLKKGETGWTVKDRFGYPANFPKLSDLVLKLRDMKIDRTFPASQDILRRLSLQAPGAESDPPAAEGRGTRIVLKGRDGRPLSEILIGQARKSDVGRGGNYVMPAGENTVYVVDKEFNLLDTEARQWIDKALMDIPSEEILRVDRIDPRSQTPIWTVKREAKNRPAELEGLPEGKTAAPARINRLMDALAAFQIDDVVDPRTSVEKTGLDSGPCFRYALFDGTVYTLRLGNAVDGDPDRTYLRASVAFDPPPEGDAASDPGKTAGEHAPSSGNDKATDATSETVKNPLDPVAAAAERDRRIGPWIFAVPQWKVDQLIADKEDFFEPTEEKAGG